MRIRAIVSAAGLAAAGLAVVPFSAAHADTTATLPLTSYSQMAVDSTHDHLFFSQGSTSKNSILVTDFSGNAVATVTGQTGVMGIALSPDGSTLYAALSGAHAVTAISTTTLQQTASYPLGDANTPYSVAVASGKLWVSYDTGSIGSSTIGDFDLSTANPALEAQSAMGAWYSAPMIATDPTGAGSALVALEQGMTPAEAASYDTAVDPVTLNAKKADLPDDCENARDLAVVPGGAQFVPACGAPYAHYRYSTADLSGQGSYGSTNYPNSIAFASGNGLVAAGVSSSSPDVYVYAQGGDTPLNTYNVPGGLDARGLGLNADGSELFAISGSNGAYTLHVYDAPGDLGAELTLSSGGVTVGRPITLDGTLRTAQASPVAGATITVTRTGPGGPATLTETTGADGSYSVTDTPTAAGTYTYTASYAGSASVAPATATGTVTVSKMAPALSISVTPTSATYRPVVHITVHLGTANGDKTVSVYAKPAGATRQALLKTGTVSSTGTMTLTFPATYNTTFSAVFAGDATYSAKTVTAAVSVKASVIMKLGAYYASKSISGVTYRLYHRTKKLAAAVLVAPNKHGECVKFDLQELYKGKWFDSLTACGKLGTNSTVGALYTLSHADLGYHYRLRAVYQRGSDTSNLPNNSAWQYFIVEK
jgi:hypothetical protein